MARGGQGLLSHLSSRREGLFDVGLHWVSHLSSRCEGLFDMMQPEKVQARKGKVAPIKPVRRPVRHAGQDVEHHGKTQSHLSSRYESLFDSRPWRQCSRTGLMSHLSSRYEGLFDAGGHPRRESQIPVAPIKPVRRPV